MTDKSVVVVTDPAEILARARESLALHVPDALARVVELLYAQDDKVALAAAKDLLDRAGLSARTAVDMNVSVRTLDSDIDALLSRLAKPAPVIDVNEIMGELEAGADDEEELEDIDPSEGTVTLLVPRSQAS
jgi:hypothetical protein